jgi:malonate-semialdehyde dehydrogenase (acetylating) / methylmalonate-semialdehyde dehydrogenase
MAFNSREDEMTKVLKNYIDGEWVKSTSSVARDLINPATGELLAQVPVSTREEADAAVEAAARAYPEWRNTPPVARSRYLHRLIPLMEDMFNELSQVQTREHGKTIDESRGETRRAIEMIETATGIPSLMQGNLLEDIAAGIDEYSVNQPMGVFSCIAPFNFPLMVPMWFLPFAVACGNTFVVKSSPRTPMSQAELFKLFDDVGLPPGVVNLVNGEIEAADALMEHPDMQGVTFVGSTPVAKAVYKKCGEQGKRVIAQGGAKNFVVIMEDAPIDQAMVSLVASFFGNAGQRCLAASNLLVVGSDAFHREFADKFIETARAIKVGNGLDESVQMGPLQNKASKERVVGYIEKGLAEGAKLSLDGRQLKLEDDLPPDCFLMPSVFENVTPDMTIGKEEIFGPVACILRAGSLDEAIDIIHANPFGNAASIFTRDGKAARRFQHDVVAGNIGVNIGIVAPMSFFPFGGRKDSFFGVVHGQGRDVIRFFTEPKVVITRWF